MNPLSGGRPAMASVPTSASAATQGMWRMSPPSLPRLRWTGGVEDGARGEEEQALEESVVEAVDLARRTGRARRRGSRPNAREDDGSDPTALKMSPMFSMEE